MDGLPFPPPEELPNPGMEPWSPASQVHSLPFELQGNPKSFMYLPHLFSLMINSDVDTTWPAAELKGWLCLLGGADS